MTPPSELLIVRHPSPGLLRLRGSDRLALLHRMSTNRLDDLGAKMTRITVFTDPVGRTIDLTRVIELGEETWLLTSPDAVDTMRDWLQRHIFFQDDVDVDMTQGERSMWGLYGSVDETILGAPPPQAEAAAAIPSGTAWLVDRPLSGVQALVDGPGRWTASPGSERAYQTARILNGWPETGKEVTRETIPLEVGLWDAVSLDKGCYVGQEIIARMESRGRMARQLVTVRLSGPAEAGSPLRAPAGNAGTLSSVAQTPQGEWIGLATVSTRFLDRDHASLEVTDTGIAAEVQTVPWPQRSPEPVA